MKRSSNPGPGRSALILFVVLGCACELAGPQAFAHARRVVAHPAVTAPCAVILDADRGRLLYAKGPHVKRPPASTVKVLTALVALERLPLNAWVRVSPRAASRERVHIGSRIGEHFRVRDLLRAMLISSANDAATALAEAAAGSEPEFADLMTQKARALGARNSRFRTASGLPAKEQYSTAYDLAVIMNAARRSALILETLRQKHGFIRSREGRSVVLRNHNKMLWRVPGAVVGKTGWTRRAQHCYVAFVDSGSRHFVIAFLGSHRLWRDAAALVHAVRGGSLPATWGHPQASLIAANRKALTAAQTIVLQRRLAGKGYAPGPADGVFGPRTLAAVEQFQKAVGLEPDGIVGPKTWLALESSGNGAS